MEPMFSRPTCFPQQGSLLVVGVESLGKVVRVQQAIQQLKKLLRGQVAIHSLVLGLHGDVCWTHSIPLRKDKWMMHYFVTQKQNTAAFLRRSGRKQLFVPEQLQSSPHLPSYWWRGKRRCCRWSGSAPAAQRTLWVKPRINAAPGSLWDTQGGELIRKCTQAKNTQGSKIPEWSGRLTCLGPTPWTVLGHAWGWAVLTLPTILHRSSVGAADGMLVIRAGLDVQWLLGNWVLGAK